MFRFFRWGLMFSFVGLGLLQFVRPMPPNRKSDPQRDLFAKPDLDPVVRQVLMEGCADCHSYDTHWPWYAHVAPVSFLIAYDVREARDRLNLSEWPRNPTNELLEMYDVVDRREMPPGRYQIMHSRARLTDDERDLLKRWIEAQTRPARNSSKR